MGTPHRWTWTQQRISCFQGQDVSSSSTNSLRHWHSHANRTWALLRTRSPISPVYLFFRLQTLWSSLLIATGKMTLLSGESKYLRSYRNKQTRMSNMAWKTVMPYQNANSTLWTEPLWFSLSVPRWLHFPTKLVSAPLPPPLFLPPPPAPPFSFPHVFLKAAICFSSAGSRANRLSFPCQRQISVLFTLLQKLAELCFSTVW